MKHCSILLQAEHDAAILINCSSDVNVSLFEDYSAIHWFTRELYFETKIRSSIIEGYVHLQYFFDTTEIEHDGGMVQSPPVRENFQIQPFQQPLQQLQQFQQPFVFEEPVKHHRNHFFEPEELSCMTVANHIKDCPICSKFYNCDNSIYIVCIVLLIMVCVILLKKIIEK